MTMSTQTSRSVGAAAFGTGTGGSGEHEVGEAQREAGVRDASDGPVDEHRAVARDQEVERVQVAVRDHAHRRTWFGGEEPLARGGHVGSVVLAGHVARSSTKPAVVSGNVDPKRGQLRRERLGIEGVQVGGHVRELVGSRRTRLRNCEPIVPRLSPSIGGRPSTWSITTR